MSKVAEVSICWSCDRWRHKESVSDQMIYLDRQAKSKCFMVSMGEGAKQIGHWAVSLAGIRWLRRCLVVFLLCIIWNQVLHAFRGIGSFDEKD